MTLPEVEVEIKVHSAPLFIEKTVLNKEKPLGQERVQR